MTNANREVSEARARALLGAQEVSAAQERKGWSAITDQALIVSGGDWEAAKELSRVPLEALGAIPYPSGAVDGVKTCKQCGAPKPVGEFPQSNATADRRGMVCHACRDGAS